ncbi:hypothetical protein PIB30_059656 [Stylosanthes scabra]|uniref:Enhancer of polycomb-like protein n=1 Tax=Stylosanthes scabra TaxID=79078 RepID=A0ABU6TKW5_9FABA|nr:hypothetical protein [Stylosanthes scabra]
MPAVGMRRTTRVFGVVTGSENARVLRSGRRLWPDSGESLKPKRGNGKADEWPKKPEKNNVDAAAVAVSRGGGATAKLKQENAVSVRASEKKNVVKAVEIRKQGSVQGVRSLSNGVDGDKFFGIVYTRKRKRVVVDGKKMFGLRFSRRQQPRKDPCVFAAVVRRQCLGMEGDLFSQFLVLVLRRAFRTGVEMKELSAFLLSEPLCGVYASRGIQFLQGSPMVSMGVCQFFGSMRLGPSFSLDFSAVPHCFNYLRSSVLLRSMFRSLFLVYNPVDESCDVEDEIDFPELQIELKVSCNSFVKEPDETGIILPEVVKINNVLSAPAFNKSSRLPVRSGQYRNVNSKGIQRRRTSLRKKKSRNNLVLERSNGTVTYNLRNGPKRNIAVVASNMKLRNSSNSRPAVSLKEESCSAVNSTEGLDSSHCSANILVTESDRCYRIEGAVVTVEMSASREWHLSVKKDGLTRYTLKPEKVMRPCSSNRYTHVIMFSLDNGVKLEFPNRPDWVVFKDLYKECSDRNVPAPVPKFIPVPGVRDVYGYGDNIIAPFCRPETYILANGDELSRAMTRKTANYDMDSEDEEWLSKFNAEYQDHVSEDQFELIVDALEKACYCNPDDCFDENSLVNQCQDLGDKLVVEAVCSYWMRKRKQKRSSLLRVFQSNQSKKAPIIPKPLLRKRRSFKRQPSQFGRGKHPSILQAIVAEQDALEEKNAMLKFEHAKASANESKEYAVLKRKRAQTLMENADLAIYKATMLVRIAEAAQSQAAGESVNEMAEHFLD